MAQEDQPTGGRPRGPALLAAGLAALVLAVAWIATHEWRYEEGRFGDWAPYAKSGDEPHYLITLHSLLQDGDLDLADDYESVAAGGWEAGRRFRGQALDHHTVILDPATGRTELWHALFDLGERVPCQGERCIPFATRRPHDFPDPSTWIETPAHPPAFAAVLAAVLAPFAPPPPEVETRAGTTLVAFALATLLATAALAWRAGFGPGWTLTAAALLALASPWLVYTKSFFADGMAALPLTLGLWALVAGSPWLAGLGAAGAMWIKPSLVIVGAAWIAERLWSGQRREALALAWAMTLAGLALVVFNHEVLGRVVIAGARPAALAHGLERFTDTLVHKRHGLVLFVPWILVGLSGIGLRAAGTPTIRLWRWIALPCLLQLGVLSLHGGLGGTCYGPRYWIPFMPFLAIATAGVLKHGGRALRWTTAVLALLTAITVLPSALQSDRVWDERPYGGLLILLRGRP